MNTIKELKTIHDEVIDILEPKDGYRVLVGMGTCGISAGARAVFDQIRNDVTARDLQNVQVVPTGCIGMCSYEPIVEIVGMGKEKVSYIKVNEEMAKDIIERHIVGGEIAQDYIADDEKGEKYNNLEDIPFYQKQLRIVLKNCGKVNPESIEDYIAVDGYAAIAKVLTEMKPKEVIETMVDSGLRGRGGAGFSAGLKWSFAAPQEADQKYIICNADEGDPGAFMDRSVLEGDPHAILEAMLIGGYAIGASKGFIYVRAEYPVAVERLKIAIKQATDMGLLGKNILNSGFDFEIEIRLGAGAFVCGEETALIASIEGKRGMSRNKPPFPAVKGLWGKPTCINNVETLANIPQILLRGADWFKSFGTEKSPGTKVFALGGKINHTGLVEVPMGITLREVIYDVGGGCPRGKAFKAVQTGGPSGGCITASNLDIPLDFDNLVSIGSMMGSGGMIVMDEDNCMVDIARFFLEFTVDESCGKCVPCREGTERMFDLLSEIVKGEGTMEHLQLLEELGEHLKLTSLCALGQTAPNPVLSTIKHFRQEYIDHVTRKVCRAGVCRTLLSYFITSSCIGCGKCKKICPVGAISGIVKEPHKIDQELCIKCGACLDTCSIAIIRK